MALWMHKCSLFMCFNETWDNIQPMMNILLHDIIYLIWISINNLYTVTYLFHKQLNFLQSWILQRQNIILLKSNASSHSYSGLMLTNCLISTLHMSGATGYFHCSCPCWILTRWSTFATSGSSWSCSTIPKTVYSKMRQSIDLF